MKISFEMELSSEQLFAAICKTLQVDKLLELMGSEDLYIFEGKVCRKVDGRYVDVDDRPDLFAAICNLAVAIMPNCECRSADYITHYGMGETVENKIKKHQLCKNFIVTDDYCENCENGTVFGKKMDYYEAI